MQNHDTGKLMKQIFACMNSDSYSATGLVHYPEQVYNLLGNNISGFRDYSYPARSQAPAYVFKWSYQLENLCKRFRFDNDSFTDAELEDMLFSSFQKTQCRLAPDIPSSVVVRRVLMEARALLRGLLGKFDKEEYVKFCRFGKNAAVGVPKSQGLLHLRLARSLTGSRPHLRLFNQEFLERDNLLKEAVQRAQKSADVKLQECGRLKLSCVPKSFKSRRGIMPNTEVGNFITSGLSKYLESRLYMCGINLSSCAERHKKLARRFSETRTHVTADLSAASDSFTGSLVNALLPRDWYNALKQGRISYYTWKDGVYYMQSFMTMGIGFTFPLQTLLFYALIKSIGKLLGVDGVYSVFGDDLIYPRKIHKFITYIFGRLGFLLNTDKTFVRDHFRESCGGDYYRGVDVRPFQPEGEASMVGDLEYLSFIYKVVNGLRTRWNENEIPLTLKFLKDEILRIGYKVHQIPPSFPDSSGWRVDTPIRSSEWERVESMYSCGFKRKLTRKGYFVSKYPNDNTILCFRFLRQMPESVPVTIQFPFYWDALRRGPLCVIAPRTSIVWRSTKLPNGKKRMRPFITSQSSNPLMQLNTAQAETWD